MASGHSPGSLLRESAKPIEEEKEERDREGWREREREKARHNSPAFYGI